VRKLWLVAWTEFLYHVRQVSFFVALVLMVIFVVLLSWLPSGGRQELDFSLETFTAVEETFALGETITASEPVGYVDLAGLILPETLAAYDDLIPYSNEEEAEAALSAGEIRHYYVIEADYLENGRVRHYSAVASSLTMADTTIEALLRDNLRAQAFATRPDIPSFFEITWEDQPNPLLSGLPDTLDQSRLFTGIAILGLFAYLVNISGALLLDALLRESSARIMEVMVTTTSPSQLLGGKVLGLTLVALIQLGVSLSAGYLVYDTSSAPLLGITPELILLIAAFLLLGYVAYSGIVLMVTMLFPNISTSLQLQFFLRVLILSPAVGIFFILPDPNSTLSILLSVSPLTSALLMPLRMLVTAVAPAQIMFSLVSLIFWSLFVFWLSTRLFRAQSLLTGRRPSLRVVWLALWS
jgi:ABC-2 type transport system permease protein